MQLAEHELHDLNELTLSCVNSITNMAHFIEVAQDQELKSLLQQHFAAHVQDYNIKVAYLKNPDGATEKLQVPPLNSNFNHTTDVYSQIPQSLQPVMPRTQVSEFNDREIATAYLLTIKRAGREYAWSAMEATNPQVRLFLEDAFTMASHHAYDVWQWMVKKGYYPLQPAPQNAMHMIGQMYNMVEQPNAPMM